MSKTDVLPIAASSDIVLIRQEVRKWAVELGFSLVDQTKMITAASELARNSLDYGGGGIVRFEIVENGTKRGLQLTFQDEGPGIPDIELALTDGYTSGKGMGLGLGGSRRLVNTFEITSERWTGHPSDDHEVEVTNLHGQAARIIVDDSSKVGEARRTAVCAGREAWFRRDAARYRRPDRDRGSEQPDQTCRYGRTDRAGDGSRSDRPEPGGPRARLGTWNARRRPLRGRWIFDRGLIR